MFGLLCRRLSRTCEFKETRHRGFVSLVVLSVMLVMTLFFYASYRIVLFDYEVVSKSSDLRDDRLQQSNVSELVKSFYKDDMMKDVLYDRVEYGVDVEDDVKELFKDELRNYSYDYVRDGSGKIKDRTEWVKFRNYESRVVDGGERRDYFIKDNWTDVASGAYDPGRKSLLLPERVYVRVSFEPGVYRAELLVGSDYESKTFDLVNRGSDMVIALDDLPRSVEYMTMSSDVMLGGTSVDVLNSREVDIMVREKDVFNERETENKGVLKTIKVSLAKWSLDVTDVTVGK